MSVKQVLKDMIANASSRLKHRIGNMLEYYIEARELVVVRTGRRQLARQRQLARPPLELARMSEIARAGGSAAR